MEKQEVKKLLIAKRMEFKAEIEQYRFLLEYTNDKDYESRIDKLLDLINEIDKALEELEK
jgi:hypothetical protein